MRKEILQKIINHSGDYLLVNRYIKGSGASTGQDTWEAILISPNIPHNLLSSELGLVAYDIVEKFSETDARSCIHLGKSYSPFQYGILYKDFIDVFHLKDVPIMEFVIRCYEENITDFWKAKTIAEEMVSLAPNQVKE